MKVLVTHWARLALEHSTSQDHGARKSITLDAHHVAREMASGQRKGPRMIRREKSGRYDLEYAVTVEDGVATLDARWLITDPSGNITIQSHLVTIPGVPSTIITSLSGKVPFDVRKVIEDGPFGVLENRSVIAVRTGMSNRMILDLAPCADRPATDLPVVEGWTK
ncbi:hypothetical protein [uncultured Salinicola sp.]|uniref:hypothetical protein n=1 Tax=uncultured Salinicola sp. TaxID=1193542 RepID=UPI002606975A|nr:hypothetical protein [uncultured Salinicola sp.]